MENASRENGVVVITSKTYEDGLNEGKQIGKEQGYRNGLDLGRNECQLQKQREEAEERREAEMEARRMFWDTAYSDAAKVDPKAQAQKADNSIQNFIKDVQGMNMKEFLSTEKELNDIYDQKKVEWKKNHKWWNVLDPEPSSPMVVKREDNGIVKSIEFPSQGHKIPVTYWNSDTEAAKIQTLAEAVKKANGPIERQIAQKSLADELSELKIPQIVQLEAKRLGK